MSKLTRFQNIAVTLLLVGSCSWASTIPIGNSSFETAGVAATLCGVSGLDGCEYRPGELGVDWTFGGSSGIASEGGPFELSTPPDGTQAAFIQWDTANPASTPGTISQTLSGLTVGDHYSVSFWAAQRQDVYSPSGAFLYGGEQNFDVFWVVGSTYTLIDRNDPTSTAFTQYFTSSFLVTSDTGTLVFQALDSLRGDRTAFIDAVTMDLMPVPEPPSGFTLLIGIGFIGLGVGLRRQLVASR